MMAEQPAVAFRLPKGITKEDLYKEANALGLNFSEYMCLAIQLLHKNGKPVKHLIKSAQELQGSIESAQKTFSIMARTRG